jgi:hypothetical protein
MMDKTKRSGVVNGTGLVLVGVGLFFLLTQLLDAGGHGRTVTWPFLIIIPGLLFFAGMVVSGPVGGLLAVPGSVITMVGLILLYQATFDHYASWAYAWGLIHTALGIGMTIDGAWHGVGARIRTGQRITVIGAALFVIGFVFFELILNISGMASTALGRSIGPLLLIAAGLYLVLYPSRAAFFGRLAATPGDEPAAAPAASTRSGRVIDAPPDTLVTERLAQVEDTSDVNPH